MFNFIEMFYNPKKRQSHTGDLQNGDFGFLVFFFALFFIAPINIFADYVSLLETRYCIQILKNISLKSTIGIIKAIFIIIFDAALSFFISSIVLTLGFILFLGNSNGFSVIEQIVFPIFAGFELVFEPMAQEAAKQSAEEPLMKLEIFGPPDNSSQIVGLSFLFTSLSTSLWLVYFFVTKSLSRLLHGYVASQRQVKPINPIYQYPATLLSVSLIPIWILISAI